jgi:cyclohexanone monooxygenase
MAKRGAATVEVRQSAFDVFNRCLQRRLATSVYRTTKNYYTAATGRIVTQWPFTATRFWWMTRTARRSAMTME